MADHRRSALRALVVSEARLSLRNPLTPVMTVALPTVILVVMGLIPGLRRPDPEFGGLAFVDVFAPSLAVITLATLAVNVLPIGLASYREKGVLRRMATTPVHPWMLLAAQLVVNLVTAVVGVGLLVAVGALAFGVPFPRHPLGFALAFGLGTTALLALGLLIAAVAPNARTAGALAVTVFLLVMFFGGVYLPRFLLPDLVVRIGDFTPPGVGALFDAWAGTGPEPLPLATMAAVTVVAGAVAARTFRWE